MKMEDGEYTSAHCHYSKKHPYTYVSAAILNKKLWALNILMRTFDKEYFKTTFE